MIDLYFGTWKLDPSYGKVKDITETERMIDFSVEKGLLAFDTASVYCKGEIEKILGKYSNMNLNVITKIPANTKLKWSEKHDACQLYPSEWIREIIMKSTENLGRNDYTLLLHNYSSIWNNIDEVIDDILTYKKQGYFDKLGVSIPNGYSGKITEEVVKKIDVVEAPFNPQNYWIDGNLSRLNNKEVVLRSVLSNYNKIDDMKIKKVLDRSTKISNHIIIGMTKRNQIMQNLEIINSKGINYE